MEFEATRAGSAHSPDTALNEPCRKEGFQWPLPESIQKRSEFFSKNQQSGRLGYPEWG
jgi:hypothetical protein